MVQAHVKAAQLQLGQFQRLGHHQRYFSGAAVGFAAFDEGAYALNDLACALGLFGSFL